MKSKIKTKRIGKDVLIILLLFIWPFLIPISKWFILPSVFSVGLLTIALMGIGFIRNDITRIKIRWGLHPCSDGHTMECIEVVPEVTSNAWTERDGVHYNIGELHRYKCENCFRRKDKSKNVVEKVAKSEDLYPNNSN